jgi:hypothetical protein
MKNKFLGFAAIAIAIGTSAFTIPASKPSNKFTSYKWFKITTGIAVGAQVPSADAMYLGTGATAPVQLDCDNSNVDQCVSGFSSGQVNSSNQLIGDHQTPAPDAPGETRGSN